MGKMGFEDNRVSRLDPDGSAATFRAPGAAAAAEYVRAAMAAKRAKRMGGDQAALDADAASALATFKGEVR